MQMPKWIAPVLLSALALSLAACASQPDAPGYFLFTLSSKIPAVVLGFCHGLLAPLTLLASLVYKVRIYEWPNGGWWYDCGFVVGILAWGGAGAVAGKNS
jgi:hypothetical protein